MAHNGMSHKTYRAIQDTVKGLGCDLVKIDKSKRHFKVHLKAGDHERFFIMSVSPSDGRSLHNWRSDIKRWLSDLPDGVTERRP